MENENVTHASVILRLVKADLPLLMSAPRLARLIGIDLDAFREWAIEHALEFVVIKKQKRYFVSATLVLLDQQAVRPRTAGLRRLPQRSPGGNEPIFQFLDNLKGKKS
jgi:hypothetical protein